MFVKRDNKYEFKAMFMLKKLNECIIIKRGEFVQQSWGLIGIM